MAVEDNRNLAAAAVGAGAGATAAFLMTRRTGAAPPNGTSIVTLDEDTLNLLVAIGQGIDSTNLLLQELIAKLGEGGGGAVGGNYGVNQPYIKSLCFQCPAANVNYQLPSIPVPEGMQLVLRGWYTNGGVILVTGDSVTQNQINNSYPLLPNEVVGYRVTNADNIYVAATVAGEFVGVTVEYAQKG